MGLLGRRVMSLSLGYLSPAALGLLGHRVLSLLLVCLRATALSLLSYSVLYPFLFFLRASALGRLDCRVMSLLSQCCGFDSPQLQSAVYVSMLSVSVSVLSQGCGL